MKDPCASNPQKEPTPPPDIWTIANDIVQHLRSRWPEVSRATHVEALFVALYGADDPFFAASVLARSNPTLSNK